MSLGQRQQVPPSTTTTVERRNYRCPCSGSSCGESVCSSRSLPYRVYVKKMCVALQSRCGGTHRCRPQRTTIYSAKREGDQAKSTSMQEGRFACQLRTDSDLPLQQEQEIRSAQFSRASVISSVVSYVNLVVSPAMRSKPVLWPVDNFHESIRIRMSGVVIPAEATQKWAQQIYTWDCRKQTGGIRSIPPAAGAAAAAAAATPLGPCNSRDEKL